MFTDTINKCAATAERIVKLDRQNPFGFWVGPRPWPEPTWGWGSS
jgi:hypothetical protein